MHRILHARRLVYVFFLIILLLLGVSGCKTVEDEEVYFIKDSLYVDGHNVIGSSCILCLNYLYKGELPQLGIVSIEGDNLSVNNYSSYDATSDFMLNYKYKGYKMGVQCIQIDFDKDVVGEKMTLEKIIFDVEGEEKALQFEIPLEIELVDEDTNNGIVTPVQVVNGCGVEAGVIFAYQINEDIVLEDFSLGKYLSLENFTVSVDTTLNGKDVLVGGRESLPLEVKKGTIVVIRGEVQSDYYEGYQNFHGTSILYYKIEDEMYEQHHSLFVEGIGDEQTLQRTLEIMVNSVEEAASR